MNLDLNLRPSRQEVPAARYGIGVVGAGFIMRDVQLRTYTEAGFRVAAITSRTPEIAREVADLYAIPRVYENVSEMLRDDEVEILDIAVPPDKQLEIVRIAVNEGKHLKGILAQKPLAVNYDQARDIVELCESRGLPLAVNQNMRHDQSIRALKTILDRGYLGTPVLATIEMRAVPHWQAWLPGYQRLTLLNMSVHHIDSFRFLFGEPDSIFVTARKDPRTNFPHEDGICLYTMEFPGSLLASAWDDVWAGPRTSQDDLKPYIKWRVEGTEGLAEGTLGWPQYPNHTPSTLTFTSSREPNVWFTPRWSEVWFPDAFQGPMRDLMHAIAQQSAPETNGRDNLKTMAVIEAAYRSLRERRSIPISEAVPEMAPARR